MHIAFVSRLFGSGGVAVYHRTLARALVEQGHRATILTSRRAENELGVEEMDGVRVCRLLLPHQSWIYHLPIVRYYARSIGGLKYSFLLANHLKTLERDDPPDVIEFAEVGGEAFAYLRGSNRRPVVVRCHTPTFVLRRHHLPEEMPFDTRLTEAMEKYCIRHAEALTAPSYDMARTVARDCGIPVEGIHPIPNPLDVDAFMPEAGAYTVGSPPGSGSLLVGIAQDDILILHVGRLERVKGIGVLAQAIPLVLEQTPQARFVFIGAGRSTEVTQDWRQRLETVGQGRVTFLGFLEQDELRAWYLQAHIAVVPSLNYESFSYTCAQAMAAGLPVVASRIGGIPETVDDGVNGILFQPGDAAELTNAIINIAHRGELRTQMGAAGRDKAVKEFNSIQVAKEMLKVYSEI